MLQSNKCEKRIFQFFTFSLGPDCFSTMIRAIAKSRLSVSIRHCRPVAHRLVAARFNSIDSKPKEMFTKINDTQDPQRSKFFQYSWGSWMKDDKIEKARRQTKFSIEGITKLLQDLNVSRHDSKFVDNSGEPFVKQPSTLKDGTVVLSHNLTTRLLGEKVDSNEAVLIKSIASIHEGKHHRIYKVSLASGKDLVLRIPYKLESDHGISAKIKSEVATLDFLDLKLGLNVPKVVAYGDSRVNSLESPFILMEFIEGDLLMKQWDPLVADEEENATDKLKEVINPIIEFQDKMLSVTFNKFGSLYFHDDVEAQYQSSLPYDGEESPLLKDRWRIGPSVEKHFLKNKNKLSAKQINQYSGPIDADKPMDLVTAVADIEIENLKNKLALAQADAGGKVEDIDDLKSQIQTFENLKAIGSKLLNPSSKAIMNVEELFKPRLHAPDLDPLNVILNSRKDNAPYFIDFEYTSIKPFILTTYPAFIAYHGAKVYNLEEDIPEYEKMDDVEKQQYQFMYYKTRNERLWETALNELRHDLIAVASPHVKVLKSPYTQALEVKTPDDHLYVDGSIIQLQPMWDAYVSNGLCNTTDSKFPVDYSDEYLQKQQKKLESHQLDVVSTPFAATGGWVPQDMFSKLQEQGIIVEEGNGNYKVETEAALKE